MNSSHSSFHPFDLFQFSWLLTFLASNALVLGTLSLWTVRVGKTDVIMYVLIGIAVGLSILSGIVGFAVRSRRAWKWCSWITFLGTSAAAIYTNAKYGLFTLGTTAALILSASVLGVFFLLMLILNLVDESKGPLYTKSELDIPGLITFISNILLLGLGIAMFVDVQSELNRLCPGNSICSLVSTVKWIVVGACGGVVLVTMVWSFVSGCLSAKRQDQVEQRSLPTIPASPGSYLDQDSRINTTRSEPRRPVPQLQAPPPPRVQPMTQVAQIPMTQVAMTVPPMTQVASIPYDAPVRQASFRTVQTTMATTPVSPTTPTMKRYQVVRSYRANAPDELTIMPGERLTIMVEYGDGWAFCRKTGTETYGVVPLVCLKLVDA